ncbi:MAG: cell division protein SepF [Candidatus Nanohaloarchaeota archaeon]|nr:cell division protein SepF [Candidatus Nanohaloarchaeota archaeon]
MVIKKLLKKQHEIEGDVEEWVELEGIEYKSNVKMFVRIITLNDFSDVERVQNELRNGNIVWLRIRPLKEKDMIELKRAIDRLKKTVMSLEGDIAGVDEDYIILTPEGVRISRTLKYLTSAYSYTFWC